VTGTLTTYKLPVIRLIARVDENMQVDGWVLRHFHSFIKPAFIYLFKNFDTWSVAVWGKAIITVTACVLGI